MAGTLKMYKEVTLDTQVADGANRRDGGRVTGRLGTVDDLLRARLDELRRQRAELEGRHVELQQMLNRTASDYVRTGGALDELERQLELVRDQQNPPQGAEGGSN
ncbi:MAG: hypothetical protein FVQ81_05480 [Candidatus Glassbacteria bacterium]|nr:hypothetical protein [Candidatus Glassbacteria bacterium]